jgi:hypothetical protein
MMTMRHISPVGYCLARAKQNVGLLHGELAIRSKVAKSAAKIFY